MRLKYLHLFLFCLEFLWAGLSLDVVTCLLNRLEYFLHLFQFCFIVVSRCFRIIVQKLRRLLLQIGNNLLTFFFELAHQFFILHGLLQDEAEFFEIVLCLHINVYLLYFLCLKEIESLLLLPQLYSFKHILSGVKLPEALLLKGLHQLRLSFDLLLSLVKWLR